MAIRRDSLDSPLRSRNYYPQARAILQLILDGYGDSTRDSKIIVLPVIPKACKVHINSYKQADSFDLILDARDLPLDPQLIRAGSAEIYMFQTAGLGNAQRVLDRRSPLADPDTGGVRPRDAEETLALEMGISSSVDRFTLGNKPRIVGLFDDVDMELSESGKWITIKGQDYTAHLMALQFPPMPNGAARRIPTGKRLDLIVDALLEEADPDRQLSVAVRGIDPADMPIVGTNEARNNRRGIPVEQQTSYWDVIYKLVERHGFICFVDGLDVVISRPKTITDRDVAQIKRMAWGKNLEHLTLRRHLGQEQAPTVVVRSYDAATGKTISVEYPEGQIDRSTVVTTRGKKPKFERRVKEKTRKAKGGKVKTTVRDRDEYQIVTVHGITDAETLSRIAENRYHLLGKAEREIVARTRDLRDLKGVDILDVSAGDAFTIEWDEFNRELMANPKVTEQAKIAHLESRGFGPDIALEIARRYDVLQGLSRPLRFKEGTIEYDADSGISIEMQLQDFIVIDGIRDDDGASREPTLDGRRKSLVGPDGKPLGWDKKTQQAKQRQFDRQR